VKSIFIRTFFVFTAGICLFFPAIAASDKMIDPETGMELIDGGREPLSETGKKLGIELYPRDESDICRAEKTQIRVVVTGQTQHGTVKLELYSGSENFLKKKGKLRRIRVPAVANAQLICMDVEPGSYSVVGYQDKDANRRLKKRWDFKPLEPYGLSNNPEIKSLRMPKYSETSFDVPAGGADIQINLIDLKKKD